VSECDRQQSANERTDRPRSDDNIHVGLLINDPIQNTATGGPVDKISSPGKNNETVSKLTSSSRRPSGVDQPASL